ncbi:MAG: hypothetical protein JNL89_07650, partial [Rhodanobacteraceae bacterium]|nr:hypothetical protein [Rhodanobacteraceae bacterium]
MRAAALLLAGLAGCAATPQAPVAPAAPSAFYGTTEPFAAENVYFLL